MYFSAKWQPIFTGYNKSYKKLTVKTHWLCHWSNEEGRERRRESTEFLLLIRRLWLSGLNLYPERQERVKLVYVGAKTWTYIWHCILLHLTETATRRNQKNSTHPSLSVFRNSSWSHYCCSANIRLRPSWVTISVGQNGQVECQLFPSDRCE